MPMAFSIHSNEIGGDGSSDMSPGCTLESNPLTPGFWDRNHSFFYFTQKYEINDFSVKVTTATIPSDPLY